MDYATAQRVRDCLEAATLEEVVTGPALFPADHERVQQRYVIGMVMTRDPFNFNSDYLVVIPTGCGTPGCWNAAPPAGQISFRRKVGQAEAAA